jgi:hypothetical protein
VLPPKSPLFISLPASLLNFSSQSMGKYMRKSKIAGDVAAVIMESPSHITTVCVRTRAKTLALHKSLPNHFDSSSFLQLYSRRLRKVPPPLPPRKDTAFAGNSRLHECSVEKLGNFCVEEENENSDGDFAVDGSFSENFVEIDGRDRYKYSSISLIFGLSIYTGDNPFPCLDFQFYIYLYYPMKF